MTWKIGDHHETWNPNHVIRDISGMHLDVVDAKSHHILHCNICWINPWICFKCLENVRNIPQHGGFKVWCAMVESKQIALKKSKRQVKIQDIQDISGMWPLPTTVGKVCKGSPSLPKKWIRPPHAQWNGRVEHPKVCGTGIFTNPSMA